MREALQRLDPLWDELFPAEQARIVQLLVERVDVSPDGVDIRLRTEGLSNLTAELDAVRPEPKGSVMAKPKIKSDGRTITVRVPISIRKRGGRKVVLAPDGTVHDPRKLLCQQVDNAMVKAIARAFRWREMLENGTHATIKEIANDEESMSPMSRGSSADAAGAGDRGGDSEWTAPGKLTLALLMKRFDPLWNTHRATLLRR